MEREAIMVIAAGEIESQVWGKHPDICIRNDAKSVGGCCGECRGISPECSKGERIGRRKVGANNRVNPKEANLGEDDALCEPFCRGHRPARLASYVPQTPDFIPSPAF